MARPSKYNPKSAETICAQARKLCELGATDKDLAEFFEVDERTLNGWKSAHPEFFQSLKESKAAADARVERSLYERALGYSHPAVKVFCQNGVVITEDITEHYPPDTTAAIFWLKNRKPEEWRDVKDVRVTAREVHDLSDAELYTIAGRDRDHPAETGPSGSDPVH